MVSKASASEGVGYSMNVTYQAQTGGEDDNLIVLGHASHVLVHTGALEHVDLVDGILNLDWDNEIGIIHRLQPKQQHNIQNLPVRDD